MKYVTCKFKIRVYNTVAQIQITIKMLRRFFNTFLDNPAIPLSNTDIVPSSKYVVNTIFSSSDLESLNWLHSYAPCFPVKADKITILKEPQDFYNVLLSKCQNAKYRITLASLYLGTEEPEQLLVRTIQDNLNKSQGQLKINILLDYTRGTRGKVNSKTLLLPLLQKHRRSVKLSLYHTPSLRGLTRKLAPPRWNELMGLQHMKIYLIDDTLIISGANLSKNYFTNRQDRYIMIQNNELANFYAEFIGKVQEFSLQVNADDTIGLHKGWQHYPYKGERSNFVNNARKMVLNHFESSMYQYNLDEDADTWVFPLTEMGQLGIHHDSVITERLLSSSSIDSKIKFATGYFNLTKDYMHTIIYNCKAICTLLMAHPNANGFQGAKGPAGGIPAAYTLLARKFYSNVTEAEQNERVEILEYQKEGWSYHAKGLWYYLPETDLPVLTLVGSSNFGERSVNRDLETQICLVTLNKNLQQRLQNECDSLYNHGTKAEQEISERVIPKWVKAVVCLFRNYF